MPNKQYRLTEEEFALIKLLRYKSIPPLKIIENINITENKSNPKKTEGKLNIITWNFPK